MRLEHVHIRNFRSIANVVIPFEPSCRILVGINESGKSNILEALALLDPERDTSPDDLRDFGPREKPDQPAFVDFVFILDNSERRQAWKRASGTMLSSNRSTPLLLLGQKQLSLVDVFDLLPKSIYRADVRTGDRHVLGYAVPPAAAVARGWKTPSESCPQGYQINWKGSSVNLRPLDLIHESVVEEIPSNYLQPAVLMDVYTVVVKAYQPYVLEQLPPCVYWSFDEENLLPAQVDLTEFTADPSTCEPLRNMFALADFPDPASAIKEATTRSSGMRNLLNRVARRATNHMHAVWREYQAVTIELSLNGNQIEPSIRDHFNHFELSRRSDGFKRFVTFLLMVSAQVKTRDLVNALYLQDEPDVSLHPSGARYLRDELIRIAGTNYVVFSAHSIFMVDREVLSRHLIVEKRNEVTSVKEANESNVVDEEVIYNALGYSIFENLRQQNLLFEGWRDKRLFQVALEGVPTRYKKILAGFSKVGVTHARGVKDIGRVTPMLELAGRDWVVISDSDRPAVEQQRLYDGQGPWYRYNELLTGSAIVTGEDFVKPEAVRAATERIVRENAGLPQLTVQDLGGARPKMEVLRSWLQSGGLSGEQIKLSLDIIKEQIFSKLNASQIESSYFEFLKALAVKLKL